MVHDLWRHIERRSECQIQAFFRVELRREAEVSNSYVQTVRVFLHEKNVFWLQVSVRDMLLVHVVQAFHHLQGQLRSLVLGEAFE